MNQDDWCPPSIDYSRVSFPALREWQPRAIAALREGFKNGHRRQILTAPTGGGKTLAALHLLHGSLVKGRRAIFICDRTALIDQTSARADQYGMEHGIIQANHWRRNNDIPFQICSIQTITKRGYWPAADLIVIDEAHCQHSAALEKMRETTATVIGLTATPCTEGLGKHYTNLVSPTTMHELTDQGVLVPLRILTCVRPDMAGAETSGGEWTARAAAEREMTIIGDVVNEWLTHGEGRKTIAFGADIAYANELVGRFNAAGVASMAYTSETPDDERVEIVREFEKPESRIRVLVSVAALSRGFDVADIGCIIDARPLRKSLSEVIQQWGRGLRSAPSKKDCVLLDHCIASGQRVLTDVGLVAIEKITADHKLWDGQEFVSHHGVISRGVRPVIRYAGLTATADHPVKTTEGWRTLGYCAEKQIAIRTTGIGRTALRECDDYFSHGYMAWTPRRPTSACALRMRWLWLSCNYRVIKLARWAHERLQRLQSTASNTQMAASQSGFNEAAMSQSERPQIYGLWGTWDRIPFRLSDHLRSLDKEEFRNTCRSGKLGIGSHRQFRPLRSGESALGDKNAEYEQSAQITMGTADASIQNETSRSTLRRYFSKALALVRTIVRSDYRTMVCTEPETEREVWDILHSGPRNSFTCEGLLVHNSGNSIRFLPDFERVYFEGFKTLDDGEKADKKIRKDVEDYVPKGCPKCNHKPFHRRCLACGYEKQTKSEIDESPGVMKEIRLGGKRAASDRHELWQMIVGHVRFHSNTQKPQGYASTLFRSMAGEWPPRDWHVDFTEPKEPSKAVKNEIRRQLIAYRNRPERHAAP